jgi:sulfur relay (sulfurtransferase) DsrC/TusE family protein
MRVYYNEHGAAPDVRHTAKQMGVDLGVDKKVAKTKLFELRQLFKISCIYSGSILYSL